MNVALSFQHVFVFIFLLFHFVSLFQLPIYKVYSKIYKTGDFASFHKGIVYYEGRTDSQIKIRGHRVDLTEVEKNLTSLDYIEKGIN
jgi:acyl-coenzyme A synthetase/AMP-(fatty) acid ligase